MYGVKKDDSLPEKAWHQRLYRFSSVSPEAKAGLRSMPFVEPVRALRHHMHALAPRIVDYLIGEAMGVPHSIQQGRYKADFHKVKESDTEERTGNILKLAWNNAAFFFARGAFTPAFNADGNALSVSWKDTVIRFDASKEETAHTLEEEGYRKKMFAAIAKSPEYKELRKRVKSWSKDALDVKPFVRETAHKGGYYELALKIQSTGGYDIRNIIHMRHAATFDAETYLKEASDAIETLRWKIFKGWTKHDAPYTDFSKRDRIAYCTSAFILPAYLAQKERREIFEKIEHSVALQRFRKTMGYEIGLNVALHIERAGKNYSDLPQGTPTLVIHTKDPLSDIKNSLPKRYRNSMEKRRKHMGYSPTP